MAKSDKNTIKHFERLTSEYWSRDKHLMKLQDVKAHPLAHIVSARAIEDAAIDLLDSFDYIISQTESPIEEMLAAAMLALAPTRGFDQTVFYTGPNAHHGLPSSARDLYIEPQFVVSSYRTDFRISKKEYSTRMDPPYLFTSMIVECDGHEFHEKTKQQAGRDKKRDRALQALGYPVYRYTGSEIWKDPYAIAAEILTILRKQEVPNAHR